MKVVRAFVSDCLRGLASTPSTAPRILPIDWEGERERGREGERERGREGERERGREGERERGREGEGEGEGGRRKGVRKWEM